MRLRVLGVLSVLSLLMVVGTAYALLSAASRGLTQELQINRVAALNRLAQVAADGAAAGDRATVQAEMDTYSGLYGEGLIVRTPEQTLSSGDLDQGRTDVRSALVNAGLNLSATTLTPLQPFGAGTQLLSRSFGSANQVLGEVVLEVDAGTARDKLRGQWLLVSASALALETTLLILAMRVTQWVVRPVHRLNAAVRALAATGSQLPLPEDGPPELRELSHSFTTMARTVTENLDQQRHLIAETSHQLRNPVAALRLRMDLLQLRLEATPEHDAAAAAVAELDRVEGIIDDMLRLAAAEHLAAESLARSALGPPKPTGHATADPHVVVREELERAAPAALVAASSLRAEGESDPGIKLDCNPVELSQMVSELLANAIKYAPGAAIVTTIRVLADKVEIEVADDGAGLPPEEIGMTRTRFWRSPRHRDVRGSGLGLAIVDQLALANGGRLRLGNRQPHGLAATLVFPRGAATGAAGG